MASRKTAKPKEEFFILWSECGSTDQFEVYDENSFSSIKAAKDSIGEGECSTGKVVIVKVVATGSPKGFSWH